MTEQGAAIVVKPGTVTLDDLARVLAGASVVLDPSFWPRVEAASEIVAKAAHDPSLRGGAWEYHSAWTGPAGPNLISKAGVLTPAEPPGVPLIVAAPAKPIRFWFFGGDQDLFYPNPTIPDGMGPVKRIWPGLTPSILTTGTTPPITIGNCIMQSPTPHTPAA